MASRGRAGEGERVRNKRCWVGVLGGRCQLLKMSWRPGRDTKAEAGSGGASEEKASWLQARAEGRGLGREGKGHTVQQGPEAPWGRARQLLRAGGRHQEPKQGPGNMWKQLKWGGWDGKARNRGFGG